MKQSYCYEKLWGKKVRILQNLNQPLFRNSFTRPSAAIILLLYSSRDKIKQHPPGVFHAIFWADNCLHLGGCVMGTSRQVDKKSCSDAAGCQFGAVSTLNRNRLCFREELSHKSCQSGPLHLTARQCVCVCVWLHVCVHVCLCDEVQIGSGVLCLFPLHNEEVMSSQTSCWLPLSNSLPSACRWLAIVSTQVLCMCVFKRASRCLPLPACF